MSKIAMIPSDHGQKHRLGQTNLPLSIEISSWFNIGDERDSIVEITPNILIGSVCHKLLKLIILLLLLLHSLKVQWAPLVWHHRRQCQVGVQQLWFIDHAEEPIQHSINISHNRSDNILSLQFFRLLSGESGKAVSNHILLTGFVAEGRREVL